MMSDPGRIWDPGGDVVMNCRSLSFPFPSLISQNVHVLNKIHHSCPYWPVMRVFAVLCFNHPCWSYLRSTLVRWLLFYAGFDLHLVIWRMYGAGLVRFLTTADLPDYFLLLTSSEFRRRFFDMLFCLVYVYFEIFGCILYNSSVHMPS